MYRYTYICIYHHISYAYTYSGIVNHHGTHSMSSFLGESRVRATKTSQDDVPVGLISLRIWSRHIFTSTPQHLTHEVRFKATYKGFVRCRSCFLLSAGMASPKHGAIQTYTYRMMSMKLRNIVVRDCLGILSEPVDDLPNERLILFFPPAMLRRLTRLPKSDP